MLPLSHSTLKVAFLPDPKRSRVLSKKPGGRAEFFFVKKQIGFNHRGMVWSNFPRHLKLAAGSAVKSSGWLQL